MKAGVYLFKGYTPDKEGNYPISICVSFIRDRKYYPITRLSSEEFIRATEGKRLTESEKKISKLLNGKKSFAETISAQLGELFTYESFEKHYLNNKALRTTLKGEFDYYIENIDNDRPGTISAYECARNSFYQYKSKAKVSDITVKFLSDYENWMLENGKSITTVGMYCRALRSLINELIDNGDMAAALYPFGKKKYEIPTSKNTKKALSISDINKLITYECSNPDQQRALDYWYFLCMANGINVADFCRLKWDDINGDIITFVREKTKRTKRDVQPIEININPEIEEIINKHGIKTLIKDAYIFPILSKSMTAEQAHKAVQNCTRSINHYVGLIAKELGIKHTTTYSARHSFATILQNENTPVGMISKMLGHSNIATTENYLGSFAKEEKKKATSIFGNLKNIKAI